MKIKSIAELVKYNTANDIEIEINVEDWLKENDQKNFAKFEKIREEVNEFWAEAEEEEAEEIEEENAPRSAYNEYNDNYSRSLLDIARNLNQYFNKDFYIINKENFGIKFTEMKKDISNTGELLSINFIEVINPKYYDFVEYYYKNWTISGPTAEEMFIEFYKLSDTDIDDRDIDTVDDDYITDCLQQENTQNDTENDTKTENDTQNDTTDNTTINTQNYPKIKNTRNFRADIRSARAPPDI